MNQRIFELSNAVTFHPRCAALLESVMVPKSPSYVPGDYDAPQWRRGVSCDAIDKVPGSSSMTNMFLMI